MNYPNNENLNNIYGTNNFYNIYQLQRSKFNLDPEK